MEIELLRPSSPPPPRTEAVTAPGPGVGGPSRRTFGGGAQLGLNAHAEISTRTGVRLADQMAETLESQFS